MAMLYVAASTPMHTSPADAYRSIQHSSADGALQLLQHAFHAYIEIIVDQSTDAQKDRLAALHSQLQSKGLHGYNSIQVLTQLHDKIAWERFDTQQFTSFYRFTFLLCREPGKRNVQSDVAVAGWQLVLRGRFRLLDKFCEYVGRSQQGRVVTEDTWRQVWSFSRSVHEDLSNYDPNSAWPVLLDEFVEELRGSGRAGGRQQQQGQQADEEMALQQAQEEALHPPAPWLTPARMGPISPDCGSKRKCPSLDTVVDQIDLLPAMVSHGNAAGGRLGSTGSGAPAGRALKHVKRRRLADAHMSPGGCDGGYHSDGSATPTCSGSVSEAACPGMAEVMTATVTEALGLG